MTHLIDSSVGWEISNTNLSTGWCSLSMITTTTFSASFWKKTTQSCETTRVSLNQPKHRVTSYLLNEWLHTVKGVLNVLIQLWVT